MVCLQWHNSNMMGKVCDRGIMASIGRTIDTKATETTVSNSPNSFLLLIAILLT